jgi:hypothetical protein
MQSMTYLISGQAATTKMVFALPLYIIKRVRPRPGKKEECKGTRTNTSMKPLSTRRRMAGPLRKRDRVRTTLARCTVRTAGATDVSFGCTRLLKPPNTTLAGFGDKSIDVPTETKNDGNV